AGPGSAGPGSAGPGSSGPGSSGPGSADYQEALGRRDQLADDRVARDLARHQQAARGLGIGKQYQLVLVQRRREVGSYPLEVAAAAAGHVPGLEGLAGRLQIG